MLSTLSPLLHFNILTAQQLLVAGPLHSNCSICSLPSDSARDRAETTRHPPGEATASALSWSEGFGRILRVPFAFSYESHVFLSYKWPLNTGCPTIEYSVCFVCFLGFWCSYRGLFYHFSTAQETTIPKLTLLSSLHQKLINLQSKT